jgi:hypothetical protein
LATSVRATLRSAGAAVIRIGIRIDATAVAIDVPGGAHRDAFTISAHLGVVTGSTTATAVRWVVMRVDAARAAVALAHGAHARA